MAHFLKFIFLAVFGVVFINMILPTTLSTLTENARAQAVTQP